MSRIPTAAALVAAFLVCSAGTLTGQTAGAPEQITLPQAVEVALKNNPSLQAADFYAEAVEQAVGQAKAGYYPRLDFSEGVTRSNNPVFVFSSLDDDTSTSLLKGMAAASFTASPSPAAQSQQLRVLLAEDNKVNQTLALRLLEKRGYQVTVVEHGAQALSAIKGRDFDVVLMDVQMPEMDGFEATAALRAWEGASRKAHLPVIAMTAHALKGDRERCLEAGMDGYVAKPIHAQELISEIGRVLHPQPAAAA